MPDAYTRRWETKGRKGKQERETAPRTAAEASRSTYYGVPAIHKPHWKWLIIVYFFLGGISGASYVISAISDLFGPREDKSLVRAGRFVSFAAFLPCPILLILDLGRPERFFYMLRVLKFRSPMSVGTWGLMLFSVFSTVSALVQAAQDGLLGRSDAAQLVSRLPGRAIAAAGAGPAFLMSGYTGVLLAATAVPLWTKNALLMGPLFLASAISSAASTISIALAGRRDTSTATLERLETVERIAMAAEIGLLVASRAKLGATAKPLQAGRTGTLTSYGVVGAGLAAPLALQVMNRRRHSRGVVVLGSMLALVGGFLLRYVVVTGGNASADDPRATFEMTRRG